MKRGRRSYREIFTLAAERIEQGKDHYSCYAIWGVTEAPNFPDPSVRKFQSIFGEFIGDTSDITTYIEVKQLRVLMLLMAAAAYKDF